MSDNTKVFLGFLAGLGAGVLVGVLLAPEKGDETRKILAEKAKTFSTDFSEQWEQLNPSVDKLKQVLDSASEYANKIIAKENSTK